MVDDKLAFYLRHQKEIDEWAALRTKACEAAHSFFSGLLPRLQEASKDHENAKVYDGRSGRGWQGLGLYDEKWPPGPFCRLPVVAIEWKLGETTFSRGFFGLRIDIGAGGRRLHDAMCGLIAAKKPVLPTGGRRTKWYPYQLRTTPHREEYWMDLDGYADAIVADMVAVWQGVAPLVDEAVEQVAAGAVRS